jgi:3-phosphoshikimate 1-carboxyvinyltransferase
MGYFKILESMGNQATPGQDGITITGHGVKALEVDMRDCPDQAQTLAVLAAFADGVTTIDGVQSLHVKETERIVALEQELKKMGIKTSSTHDTLVIHGGQPHAASIATYGDHRMAMAFAVAGSNLAGMKIEDPEVVAKTFPDFWDKLASIGVSIEEQA